MSKGKKGERRAHRRGRAKRGSGPAPQRVLQDHLRQGKRFVPPMLPFFEGINRGAPEIDWIRWALPELLWIGLLADRFGPHDAAATTEALISAAAKAASPELNQRTFCLASDYRDLEGAVRDTITRELADDVRRRISEALAPFVKFYPAFPMAWLVGRGSLETASAGMEALDVIASCVQGLFDRRGRKAMFVQTTAFYGFVQSGRIKFSTSCPPPDINVILEQPDSDEGKKAAAFVRASLNGTVMPLATGSEWSKVFWKHGRSLTACRIPTWETPAFDRATVTAAALVGAKFRQEAMREVADLAEAFPSDLAAPRRPEVLLGLLQRQAEMASDLAALPFLSTFPWGEMALRAMCETLIRLSWFAKRDSADDYDWFVDYGLGQEKLHIEHLKRLLEENPERPDHSFVETEIKDRGRWLDVQRYGFLQAVDVGSGTNDKDLRKMAEDAGCADERALIFQPFSAVVHGHWNCLERENLVPCGSPLHGVHRLPAASPRPLRPEMTASAVRMYADCYEIVARVAGRGGSRSAAVERWFAAEFPASDDEPSADAAGAPPVAEPQAPSDASPETQVECRREDGADRGPSRR